MNEITGKEIEFLETKKHEGTSLYGEFKSLMKAKINNKLTSKDVQKKLKTLAKREDNLRDSLKLRKQLRLDINMNGRACVSSTRDDYKAIFLLGT